MPSTIVRRSVCAVALLVLIQTPAVAQTLDKRVIFNFSSPVTLPGRTLPAGSYLFRLPDAAASRSLIQVMSADGAKLYGTFFAIPAHRPVAPEMPEVRFMETSADATPAIRTWWYPADSTGFELIYPKEQARALAKGASHSVLTTKGASTTATETKTDDLTRISSTGQETAVDPKAAAAPMPPTGTMEGGQIASPTLVIPSHPEEAKVEGVYEIGRTKNE
jgi:hypothetical protein